MAKPRKLFNTTATLTLPDKTGVVGATQWDLSVPHDTVVNVGNNFDFGPWYHKGIDEIVLAGQQQIAHWVNTHDGDYSIKTLNACCYNGINHFLDFLLVLQSTTGHQRLIAYGKPYEKSVWLYPSKNKRELGKIIPLKDFTICQNIKRLVEKHKLQDTDGNPFQVNVSRLRATFVNRLWVLSGNDPVITARLGGHTLKVSNDHYLQATLEMQRNHKFMGDLLVQELMDSALGKSTDNTPVGKCRDPLNGDRSPKNGEPCTDFLSCFRCRSCVITGDDLYRLFSFYWLIIKERNEIGTRHWGKVYGHIIRIIDRQIAPKFPPSQVETAKAKAKDNPHPFWRSRELLEVSA